MNYVPLTDREEIAAAYDQYVKAMHRDGMAVNSYLGFHGGGTKRTVNWLPEQGMWTFLPENGGDERLWCCYGLQDPTTSPNLNITIEINLAPVGMNRRYGGALVRDDTGRIWLAHSGKIGGGRKGIGKAAFLQQYTAANLQPVRWPNGATSDRILIAALDQGEALPEKVASFIRVVAAFKKAATSGK